MQNTNAPEELILIRHGQSTANASGVWQGRLDYPLSEAGREQARAAGRALAEEKVDAFYTSPLTRASETAELIAGECGFGAEVVPVGALVERGGGLFEGSTWAERERTMPEVLEKFRSAGEEEGWRTIGAETDEEVLLRFAPAIREVMSRGGGGSRVVVVSHGGVMRAYLRALFGPETLPKNRRVPNASITRIEWPEEGLSRLLSLAETSHLPQEPSPAGPVSE